MYLLRNEAVSEIPDKFRVCPQLAAYLRSKLFSESDRLP